WGSSIDGGALGEMELDVYAGWTGAVAEGVTFDIGLLYYMYPASDSVAGVELDTDYFEPYASIGTTMGPLVATVGGAYAWGQDARGGSDNLYPSPDWRLAIPDTPVTCIAHLGYTAGALAPALLAGSTADSGLDWSVGVSATVYGGLSLGVSYVGVEGPSIDGFTDDTIVATLSFAG